MKYTRHRILKVSLAVLLAVVLAGAFCYSPKETYAAGGTARVSLASVEGLSAGTEFGFELYKVGHFEGAGLVLDEAYQGSHADLSMESDDSEGWLASAKTLATYIDGMASKPAAVGETRHIGPGGTAAWTVADNGLYLVKGSTARDAENSKINWTPQPMYIRILNGDQTAALTNNEVVTKLVRTPVALKHSVIKAWDIPEGKSETAKPAEINVAILYGTTTVDVVKLNSDNSWSWAWESEEDGNKITYIHANGEGEDPTEKTFEAADGDLSWSCMEIFTVEDLSAARSAALEATDSVTSGGAVTDDEAAELAKLSRRFTVTYPDPEQSEESEMERINITNTYSVTELEIIKNLDGYVDNGDSSNITIAFRVTGLDADGVEVYSSIAGITFGKSDDLTKSTVVTGIPVNAETITVTEVYSAGYTPKETELNAVKSEDDGKWTVTFDNTHGRTPGSGVVNKYENGAISDQQGLTGGSGN